jgi:predicted nucleic acid-binding protein
MDEPFDGRPFVADTSAWAKRDDVSAWRTRLAELREAPLTKGAIQAARSAIAELAEAGPLHHRAPVADLLIAAAAAEKGVGVLHCDRHFDRLAGVLGFESRWLLREAPAR